MTFASGSSPTWLAFEPPRLAGSSAPVLNIALIDPQVVLSWDQNVTNHYLESTTSLIPQSVWTVVTNNTHQAQFS